MCGIEFGEEVAGFPQRFVFRILFEDAVDDGLVFHTGSIHQAVLENVVERRVLKRFGCTAHDVVVGIAGDDAVDELAADKWEWDIAIEIVETERHTPTAGKGIELADGAMHEGLTEKK